MKKFYLLLLIVLIEHSSSVMGQIFTNVQINHLTEGNQNTDGGNSVAVYGDNVYVLWQDMQSTFFSYVSKSTDGGITFDNGVKVGGNDPQIMGAISIDNTGSIYAVWDGIVGEMPGGVYFSKSTDEAATFSVPITISAEGLFPQVSVYGSNVYTFFLKAKPDNKVGYFFARSKDGGITFDAPYEITDATIDDLKYDSPCSMYVDNSGNIYCIWNDGRRGTGTDIYMAISTNSGESFGANIMVNDVSGSSDKIRTGCNVAVDASNVYVVWRQEDDNQDNNRKVLFSKSTNGGSSFGVETEIANGGWGSPSLTLNSAGEIYLAYPQFTVEQNGLFCTKSNDQGNTFPVTTFINSLNADARNISVFVASNDNLYSVWTDNRSGSEDVYFAKGTITITNIEEEVSIIPMYSELLQNYPNPFNPSTTIQYELPMDGWVSLKIFDLLGREVATLINDFKQKGSYSITFDASYLTSGVYIYKMTSTNFSSVKKMVLSK